MKKRNLIILFIIIFASSGFAAEVSLLGPKKYLRDKGQPLWSEEVFPGINGEAKLIIRNGDSIGKNRVSSAEIKINEISILGANFFNQQINYIEVPIIIEERNKISIKIKSKIGSCLTIDVVQEIDADAAGFIGNKGGTISFPSESIYFGTMLSFPEGALNESTLIKVIVLEQSNSPEGSVAFKFEPEGLTFNLPPILTLTYFQEYLDKFGLNANDLNLYLQNSLSGDWDLLDSSINQDEQTITAEIWHFSIAKVSTSLNYLLYTQGRMLIDGTPKFILVETPTEPYDTSNPKFGTITSFVNNVNCISVSMGRGTLENFLSGNGKNLLLVHGFLSNAGTFVYDGNGIENIFDLVYSLEDDYDNIILYNYPSAEPIESNATALVDLILGNSNFRANFQTDIIAHSMGGLVCRYAIEKLGFEPYVENLIMLGTPNHGVPYANIGFYLGNTIFLSQTIINDGILYPSLTQLQTGSPFLMDLNQTDQNTICTKYYVIAGDIGNSSDGLVPVNSPISLQLDDFEILEGVNHNNLHAQAGSSEGAISYILTWINSTVLGTCCNISNLELCINENACIDAGGYWWNNACNSVPEIPVGTVVSRTGRIWMDRNLGATRVATSLTDVEAYGDLYQWGRSTDGHQKRDSLNIGLTSSSDDPGHSYFIQTNQYPYIIDWRVPSNPNLWQGVNSINNPCPAGFRIPTRQEFSEEVQTWISRDSAGAFESPLRLTFGGFRGSTIRLVGQGGYYWLSDNASVGATDFHMFTNSVGFTSTDKATGKCVRCIKD